jgi:hypothetical protein
MLKKCLIALILLAVSTAPTFGHAMWGYGITTAVKWEWQEHLGPPICVAMKVVMWAKLYFCKYDKNGVPDPECLVVRQRADTNTFDGCICMKLCVNFTKIRIGVKYEQKAWDRNAAAAQNNGVGYGPPDGTPSKDPTTGNDGKNYKIGVGPPGSVVWSGWGTEPSSKYDETGGPYLTGNEKTLNICIEIRNVDPQALPYDQLAKTYLGMIRTTLLPLIPPPGAPSGSTSGTWYITKTGGSDGTQIP